MTDTLNLWNAVFKTDPKYTKSFRRAGGFSGTAINFTYLARKATEQWGPIGYGWGARVIDEKYVEGHKLKSGDRAIIHVIRIEFWYAQDGQTRVIESYGQTTFVGEDKHGAFTDEEAPKKSLTDAMAKAMSWLGFAADVHLGLYDDNKYVNDLRSQFAEEEPVDPEIEKAKPLWLKDIEHAKDAEAVRALWQRIFAVCNEHLDGGGKKAWAEIRPLLEAKGKSFKEAK